MFSSAERSLVPRHAAPMVRAALSDTRVVAVNGARQVGKSTLATQVLADDPTARLLTLDDDAVRAAAEDDPTGFVQHGGTLLIDEVQRVPSLFLALKAAVDRDPRPGRFLLTGSAQVLALPRLADSLAGRMEVIELWPLSQGELEGRRESFVDALFDGPERAAVAGAEGKREYLQRAVRGGFPEAVARTDALRRDRWFEAYVATTVRRDIPDLAAIDRIEELPRLLRLLAARSAALLNVSALGRDAQLPDATLRRYLNLLETAFLVERVPAWANSRTTRAVKAPKIILTDSGLCAHLLGTDVQALAHPLGDAGRVLETFVLGELRRQSGWARHRVRLHHFRDADGVEVDAVLEAADGRVAGIEVKAGATVRSADFRGLNLLRGKAGDRFSAGVVLYAGSEPLAFGPQRWALPISALWHTTST
jgi:predicted AAA+ superfamily ATPase